MSPTGEQPKSETPLSENSTVRVSLVVTLIGLAFAAGAAHWRIGALERADDDKAALIREQAKEIAELKTSRAVSTTQLDALTKSFEGLSKDLREFMAEMRGGRNRSADWRQPRGPGQ